jgi:DNA-binding phage protein
MSPLPSGLEQARVRGIPAGLPSAKRQEQSVADSAADRLAEEGIRLAMDVTSAITWFLRSEGITRTELAKRMGITPGRVSQILSGDENLTLRTIAAVAGALGAHFELALAPNDES